MKMVGDVAVVVGGGLNALGVLRSLACGSIRTVVIDTDKNSPAMRSRFGEKRLVASLEGRTVIEAINGVAAENEGKIVLLLTEEKTVSTVSDQRKLLAGNILVRFPDKYLLAQLMHKRGFQELAEKLNCPVPKTRNVTCVEDLDNLSDLQYPCIFKPSFKLQEYGEKFKKAYKVNSISEIRDLYSEIAVVQKDMVVQEWIEGDDSDLYFCMQYIGDRGELVASFVGRKLSSWPPLVGGTASCCAEFEYEDELNRLTLDFFRNVEFSGLCSMEYKRDKKRNKFYMVEPTVGRTDFQEEVSTLNGRNIPLAAYCYELGLNRPVSAKPRQNVIWRDKYLEKWAAEETGNEVSRSCKTHRVVDAYWRWRDPVPWLDLMTSKIVAKAKSISR